MRCVPLSLLLLVGCVRTEGKVIQSVDGVAGTDSGDPGTTGGTDGADDPQDLDNDGFLSDVDCNDADPAVYPGAEEVCDDGIDNDCDGVPDDGCPTSLSEAPASLLGERSGDRAGASFAPAGDVDGDGHLDLLVGAREHSSSGTEEGRAYLVFGPIPRETRVLSDLPGITIDGVEDGGGTGKVVSGVGDLDGDGLDDVVVTSDEADTDRWTNGGLVHFFSGATLVESDGALTVAQADATWGGRNNYGWLGVGISTTEDTDGDGIVDVWIGGSGDRGGASSGGAVFLLSGADMTAAEGLQDLQGALTEVVGDEEGVYLGAAIASPGDLDGDGLADVVLGAHLSGRAGESSGLVAVVSGEQRGVVTLEDAAVMWTGDALGDRLGASVSPAGDHDQDGYVDVWVGASRVDVANADAGAAMLVSGGPDLVATSGSIGEVWTARVLGTSAGAGLGQALDGRTDIDGDGSTDLVVGMPEAGLNAEGMAGFLYGPIEGSVDVADGAAHQWIGAGLEDRAGWKVRATGDLLGTGGATLVVSSWESDRSGQDAGEVYLLTPQ